MLSSDEIKKKLGYYAAGRVLSGTTIGLGTGSTAYWVIRALAEKVDQGFEVKVVPTSVATEDLARKHGLEVISLNDAGPMAMTIDGADEIDYRLQLIKGGGGALLQEKMVAAASAQLIIIAEAKKYHAYLGSFPLPLEVVASGWKAVELHLLKAGFPKPELRYKNDHPFVTDNWHYILDVPFDRIGDARALDITLNAIPGVVETGLFPDMASTVILGHDTGEIEEISR